MIQAMTLGQLIRQNNPPRRQVIDLREYKVDPRDFEDAPLEELENEPVPISRGPRGHYKPRKLTKGQIECIRLWCAGYTYAEIASMMGITIGTIRGKLRRIKDNLAANKRCHIKPILEGMGIEIPTCVRRTTDSVSGIYDTVAHALGSGGEMAFKVPEGQRFAQIEMWAHTAASRMGGKISCRHVKGTVWIFRRAA